MIGVYNYTVWLTYMSLTSAVFGIYFALVPQSVYVAGICLMLSGLFDGFDGKVARLKKDRTDMERNFGIQIDSLTDIVAFGVLPACIGFTVIQNGISGRAIPSVVRVALFAILVWYVLAALIRLAYFNVTEEERQSREGGVTTYYTGVPVTTSSLIFPTILLCQYLTGKELFWTYALFILITAFAFVVKIPVKKPGTIGIFVMVGIGIAEVLAVLLS